MSRFTRISFCLLLSSLPLSALQAQPSVCGDGIRSAPKQDRCTCCPDPASCCCEMAPPSPQVPATHHSAVPVPAHALDDAAAMAPASWLLAPPACSVVATTDTRAIQGHPEKSLARLHVLQI